jgi:uncharacterized coiled-coil protein SlyX
MRLIHGTVIAAGLIAGTLLAQQETIKMGQQMKTQMKQKMASKDMGGHREMTQLVDNIAQSLTAIESEKDPTALAAKLAEHRKLIDQLQSLVAKHGDMMKSMQGDTKAEPAKPEPEKPADPHAGHR